MENVSALNSWTVIWKYWIAQIVWNKQKIEKTLTITSKGDKIAPVADDGDLKPPKISSAGDAEAERPGSKKTDERNRKRWEKSSWQRLADVITYTGCRLKRTEREADETEKKNKKVLDKRNELW